MSIQGGGASRQRGYTRKECPECGDTVSHLSRRPVFGIDARPAVCADCQNRKIEDAYSSYRDYVARIANEEL